MGRSKFEIGHANGAFDEGHVNYKIVVPKERNISIAWRNLRYEVKEFGGVVGKTKPILRRLNGFFECSSLNGLMGPSGAGKTTLLNCLSGNDRSGLTNESEIYLNSTEKSPVSYFIPQHVHESIIGRLRVLDIFRYAYRFKNGSSAIGRMDEHIGTVMAELMLPVDILSRHFAQCSGGEQKRIAIGQELMTLNKPTFLFVDEPTTGLDSAAAFEVMKCLKQLTAKYRITVITSIHVPSNEILQMFDKLYVLSKGGVVIYSGAPSNIQSHLAKEIHLKIPDQQPPVETLIQIACSGINDSTVTKLANKCSSDQFSQLSSPIQSNQLTLKPHGIPNLRKHFSIRDLSIQLSRQFRVTFISNFHIFLLTNIQFLLAFYFNTTLFSPGIALPSGCVPIVAKEMNSTECQQTMDNDILLRENGTFLSYTFMFTGFFTMCIGAIFVSPFVKVFRSEHRNHWYSLLVFYLSSTLITLLEVTVYTIVMSLTNYFLTNQHAIDNYQINWTRFGLYFLIIWLLSFSMLSVGQLIGTVFVDYTEVAITLSVLSNTLMTMFNNMFVNLERTGNPVLITLGDLIGLKFLTKALGITFYGMGRCDYDKEISIFLSYFEADPTKLVHYLCRVALNIFLVRLVTVAFMFVQFNTFNKDALTWLLPGRDSISSRLKIQIPIDFVSNESNNNSNGLKHEKLMNTKHKREQTLTNKVIIGWRNLSLLGMTSVYENMSNVKANKILRNLNGQFCFGTLNALMGTSGAGKTSLLRVLNGQCKTRVSDSTRFYLSRFTKIETCFITQEVSGHLMLGLTAKQFLVYASRLKNLNTQIDHEHAALSVLDKLDLMDTVDTQLDRCSGGERKRLALAAELTATVMPNLVCIDEPTSGLDSNSAETVISCLSKLTQLHPITILASIHQPNTSILSMFDQLYVLARGGVCIYSGPPAQVQSHLNQISQNKTIDSRFSIEELIKHSCNDHQNEIVQRLVQLNNLQFSDQTQLTQSAQIVPDGVVRNRTRFALQSVNILNERYFAYIRGYFWKELLFYMFIYFMMGFSITQIYDSRIAEPSGCVSIDDDFSTCSRSAESVTRFDVLIDNYKYSFFMGNMFLFVVVMQTSVTFMKDLVNFRNEHANGWYSTGGFYLMRRFYEIIPLVPLIMMHVFICNFYEDIRPGIYWNFVLVIFLAALAIQGLSHVCAILSRNNFIILTMTTITSLIVFILLGNLFIQIHKLTYLHRFIANFSVLRFCFEAIMLLQYGFGRCGPREIQPILYMMDIEDSDYYRALSMLVVITIIFHVIAIYLLVSTVNPIENRRRRVERINAFCTTLEPSQAIIPGLSTTQEFRIKLADM